MSLRVNQNISAMTVHRNLVAAGVDLEKSLQKLSTGLRINTASDDAAGLSISERLRAQVRGLHQAGRNAQDGVSLVQTAEAALDTTHGILQRMRELAVQAANDTLTSTDRTAIQAEITQLSADIDRISTTTAFNTKNLLDGSQATTGMTLQVGANAGQVIGFTIATVNAAALTLTGLSVTSQANASQAIVSLDNAVNAVSTTRSNLGALHNRLERVVTNLSSSAEQQANAESRIRDVDMAKETSSMVRAQILQQSGVAVLAQANSAPQNVLALLR